MSLISFEKNARVSLKRLRQKMQRTVPAFWYLSTEGSHKHSHPPRAQDEVEGDLALPLVPKISSLIGLLEATEK